MRNTGIVTMLFSSFYNTRIQLCNPSIDNFIESLVMLTHTHTRKQNTQRRWRRWQRKRRRRMHEKQRRVNKSKFCVCAAQLRRIFFNVHNEILLQSLHWRIQKQKCCFHIFSGGQMWKNRIVSTSTYIDWCKMKYFCNGSSSSSYTLHSTHIHTSTYMYTQCIHTMYHCTRFDIP